MNTRFNPALISSRRFSQQDDGEMVQLTLSRKTIRLLLTLVRKSFGIAVKQDEKYAAQHGKPFVPEPGHISRTEVVRETVGPIEQYLSTALDIDPITARVNGKWVIHPNAQDRR